MTDDRKWYAARVMRQYVKSASIELNAVGFPAYVPQETVKRRLGRTLRPIERPVWPGYVFVYCRLNDLAAIREVEGVTGFVRASTEIEINGVPTLVSMPVALGRNDLAPVILAEIFGDLDYSREPESWKPDRGDRVMVKSGKWKGYFARVLSVAKRKVIVETEWCKMEFQDHELELAKAA